MQYLRSLQAAARLSLFDASEGPSTREVRDSLRPKYAICTQLTTGLSVDIRLPEPNCSIIDLSVVTRPVHSLGGVSVIKRQLQAKAFLSLHRNH
jgi:hypothetical protein